MPDENKRPVWYPGEFHADRAREAPARALFEAILYVGDQFKRVVDMMERIKKEDEEEKKHGRT